MTAFVLVRRRRLPWLAVGWLWFLVTLAPTLGLVQVGVHVRADRHTCLPLAGLALARVLGPTGGGSPLPSSDGE